MQEYIKATQLAQAMRGKYGRSTQEMINFVEENVVSTDCPKINCTKGLISTRICKCGALVRRHEYELIVECENCGGYQSSVTWYCKKHGQMETLSVITMIQAMAEDMDADEEAREAKAMRDIAAAEKAAEDVGDAWDAAKAAWDVWEADKTAAAPVKIAE